MIKKIFLLLILTVLPIMVAMAQPRPYEIDTSFTPDIEFLQKVWVGSYDGLEQNSRMILSINRTLTLNVDSTYLNEVTVHIKDQSESLVLKNETGTYKYDPATKELTYFLETDSVLDMNRYLSTNEVTYEKNIYTNDDGKSFSEIAQFTRKPNNNDRQWVLFDNQLASPINPRQPAVYVMTGQEIAPAGMPCLIIDNCDSNCYDLYGRKIYPSLTGMIYIVGGKKYIKRR